jgi:ubiquinone/menaquinone biosynthesis C-methylase UbiE
VTGSPEGRVGKEYYNQSEYFDAGTEHLTDMASRFQQYRVRKVLDIYDPPKGSRVLDMGCGWGTFGFVLAERMSEIVGVDFSERSVAICNQRLEKSGLSNLSFVEANAGDTGLPADHFDLVIAADLFEHLYPDDSERVAREAFRVLKPGGRFSVWTPHRGHFLEILKNNNILLKADPTHVDYKSMSRMLDLVEGAGFGVERAYYAESHLPGLNVLERMLLPSAPFLRRRIAVLGQKAPSGIA